MKRLAALALLSLVAFAPAASAQFGQPKSDPQNTLVMEDRAKILAEKKTKQLNLAYEWMKKKYFF